MPSIQINEVKLNVLIVLSMLGRYFVSVNSLELIHSSDVNHVPSTKQNYMIFLHNPNLGLNS